MDIRDNLTIDLVANIMDQIPYSIIISNLKGEFIFWNRYAFRLFNEDLLNSKQPDWVSDWGVFNLDKVTLYKTEDIPLSRALSGEAVYNEKIYLQKANSKGIYLEVNAFPIFDKDNKVEVGVVMYKDITAEQKLYESIIHKINDLESYLQELILNQSTNDNSPMGQS